MRKTFTCRTPGTQRNLNASLTKKVKTDEQKLAKRIKNKDGRICSHCQADTTPLWRYNLRRTEWLCNACSQYEKRHGMHRPHISVPPPPPPTIDHIPQDLQFQVSHETPTPVVSNVDIPFDQRQPMTYVKGCSLSFVGTPYMKEHHSENHQTAAETNMATVKKIALQCVQVEKVNGITS